MKRRKTGESKLAIRSWAGGRGSGRGCVALQSVALNYGHADEEEAMRCYDGRRRRGEVRRTKKRAEMTFFFKSYLAVKHHNSNGK